MLTSPRDGKRARLSLGTYPATSLAKARGSAIEARGQVEEGTDPRDLGRRSIAGAMTVSMLAEDYPARHATKLRSFAEVRRKLHSDILPVIGEVNCRHYTDVIFTACLIRSRTEAPQLPRARSSPSCVQCSTGRWRVVCSTITQRLRCGRTMAARLESDTSPKKRSAAMAGAVEPKAARLSSH